MAPDGEGGTKLIIYLAGPMTGIPEWNKPEFDRVTELLSEAGHTVLNPASYIPLEDPEAISHTKYLHIAFAMIDAVHMLVLLPGWEKSKGACMEHDYATKKSIPCIDWEIFQKKLLFEDWAGLTEFAINSDAMEPDANGSGLVDSGQRTEMGSGAVRETANKGRCDLLPWDILFEPDPNITGFLSMNVTEFCESMAVAVRHGDGMKNAIEICLNKFDVLAFGGNRAASILAASHQFEAGAIKYKDGRNWEAGIPLDCFLSSAGRHFLKYLRGDTDGRTARPCGCLESALRALDHQAPARNDRRGGAKCLI